MSLDPAAVEAFLRANPRFLAERPGLYAALQPPLRIHGENLADHMAAMLGAAREETLRAAAAGRAARDLCARVVDAVLALEQGAPLDIARDSWPGLLGVESCRLLAEGAPRLGFAPLPAGAAARLLPAHRDAMARDAGPDAALLHGEAAPLIRREAVIRLPGSAPALLALGAREAASLPGECATLALLGRALGAALAA